MLEQNIITYTELPDDIPFNATVNIDTTNVISLSHGFHKYPGKFIPQIPEWGIKKYLNNNGVILDPFVGSGTTLVESLVYGYDSYGVDIDPLSCMIAKVKSTPLPVEQFNMVADWVLSSMISSEALFTPETNNLSHWFTEDATNKLSKIRTTIEMVKEEFHSLFAINDIYDALIIAFSGIIRRVSNADNQSQKTYVSHTKIKKPAEVYSLYTKQLNMFKKTFDELESIWNKKTKTNVVLTDGKKSLSELIPSKIDLIITSPPYIKSIDYVYNQMVELFWVGDLFDMNTQPKQNIKRKKYTGTTMVKKDRYKNFSIDSISFESEEFLKNIREILKDDKNGQKHAHIVDNYFTFMHNHFIDSYNILEEGGYYMMAVGNSSVSGVEIDTASLLIDLAGTAGFSLENKWKYLIKNHFMGFNRKNKGGKILEDHVLIFKK